MIIDPIAVERLRHRLATKRKINEFKRTYTSEYPEIKNENKPAKWDFLNSHSINISREDPMANARIEYVSKEIKNFTWVLDVGFGSGNLEKRLIHKNKKIDLIGVDMSPRSVAMARNNFPQWKFFIGKMSRISQLKQRFDYIISLEMFEHIPPSRVIKYYDTIHSLIKPGGRFIISVPLNEGLEKMLSHGENPNAHVRIYTPEIIQMELEVCGFRILKIKYLYAFHSLYLFKSFIANYFFKKFKPNNIICVCEKK